MPEHRKLRRSTRSRPPRRNPDLGRNLRAVLIRLLEIVERIRRVIQCRRRRLAHKLFQNQPSLPHQRLGPPRGRIRLARSSRRRRFLDHDRPRNLCRGPGSRSCWSAPNICDDPTPLRLPSKLALQGIGGVFRELLGGCTPLVLASCTSMIPVFDELERIGFGFECFPAQAGAVIASCAGVRQPIAAHSWSATHTSRPRGSGNHTYVNAAASPCRAILPAPAADVRSRRRRTPDRAVASVGS
jgi:hypothetical protein